MNVTEEDSFECPVCFLLPEKEVYQCEKGHILCHKCSASLQQCPQCRVSIADGRKYRNLFMERTLDKLRVACEFKDKGCGEKLKRGEVAAHSRSCEFGRTLSICKLLRIKLCDFKIGGGSLSEIIPHLEASHRIRLTRCQMLHLPNFFQFTQGINSYTKPIEFEKPRDKILFVGHIEDGYVSWLCFDMNETTTIGLTVKISSVETPSILWEVPILPIMDAEKYFKYPPSKIHIPYLNMVRKERNPAGVQEMDYRLVFL